MKYRNLGRAAVQVSPLCLGTMNFGPHTDEAASRAIMDRAHEHGLNFFDTADVYGWKLGEGVTEQILGRWFALGGGRRDKTILATKVFGKMGEWPNQSKLSALHIARACEESLRRLKTDHIDLYQMHHVWNEATWDEIWQALENLVRQGKVIYVGSSNFAAWNIAQASETARARHFLGLVSEQSLYNLSVRAIELEVIPACRAYGLGLLPWSPLGGGLLAGGLDGRRDGRRGATQLAEKIEQLGSRLVEWEKLCRELEEQPANVALAWLLHNEAVTAPIIGPRTIEQLDGALRALEIRLSKETLARLDRLFPGPGGEAPQAYAW